MALVDRKEELTVIHDMVRKIFRNFDPNSKYDGVCGENEFLKSEGLFPENLKHARNRQCVLCDKYKIHNSRVRKLNRQETRTIWVHPDISVLMYLGADAKNVWLQYNLKATYCLFCKCYVGKKGAGGGWVQAILSGVVYEERKFEEMIAASEAWKALYEPFLRQLELGRISIPDGQAAPTTEADKMKLFKNTEHYTKNFKVQYPEYRGEMSHTHFDPRKTVKPDTLHAKLHFGDIAFSFVCPLIELLEDGMEGHANHQALAALSDTGLAFKAVTLKAEMEKNSLPRSHTTLLVDGLRTATYEAFITKRKKNDLLKRLHDILEKDEQLRLLNSQGGAKPRGPCSHFL